MCRQLCHHVNSDPKKAEETAKQNNDDNICGFESGYGDSLKEHSLQQVMPQNKTEKEKDEEITTKTRSQLLLEQFDEDGNYIGNDSETEESEVSDEEEEQTQ